MAPPLSHLEGDPTACLLVLPWDLGDTGGSEGGGILSTGLGGRWDLCFSSSSEFIITKAEF